MLARMAERKSSSRARKALTALLLWCVLAAVPATLANQATSVPLNHVSPTVRFDRTEFFLGEQVAFETGKRTAQEVDGPALGATLCELRVVRPDGEAIVKQEEQEGGLVAYNGPSRVSFLAKSELLNDLDDHLVAGRYQILYACGSQKTSVSIQMRELPILRDIHVLFQFPEQVRLSKDKIVKLKVVVSNQSAMPIEIVVPDSNYWARVIAFADYQRPPAWTLFESNREAEAIKNPNFRTRISSASRDKLQLHTIPAKSSYSTQIECRGAADGGALVDPRWLPTDEFEIVGGLVLPLFLPEGVLPQGIDRPIELLTRSKACYAATGERQNTGCEGAIRHWPRAPLD